MLILDKDSLYLLLKLTMVNCGEDLILTNLKVYIMLDNLNLATMILVH
jgi:hypothetical protein